jgi:hypothetical protein
MASCLLIGLILALSLVPNYSSPVAALSIEDYFEISYEPVGFSKTDIYGDEVFYATIKATATCINSLPLPVSEARITGLVTATHQVSGAKVTLNSSYKVTIDPFPNKEGEITQARQDVPLQFPEGSQSGTYSVVGELIEAKVNTLIGWLTVTSYLPPSQTMGSVTYATPDEGGGGESTPPAAFIISALSITPQEVNIGDEVTISALVTNTGNLEGIYRVALGIDSQVVEIQEINLAGGASQVVTFKISENVADIYSVNINGLSGSFVVKAAATLEPAPAPTSTPPPAKPINWPVVYGVVAALVAMSSLLFFLARRRHTKSSS